jgi:hypothetical protein
MVSKLTAVLVQEYVILDSRLVPKITASLPKNRHLLGNCVRTWQRLGGAFASPGRPFLSLPKSKLGRMIV